MADLPKLPSHVHEQTLEQTLREAETDLERSREERKLLDQQYRDSARTDLIVELVRIGTQTALSGRDQSNNPVPAAPQQQPPPKSSPASLVKSTEPQQAPASAATTPEPEAAGALVPELPVPTHDAPVANHTPTATWGDLKLVFVSDNEVNIFIRDKSHGAKNYEELGFVGKGGRPSQAWIVLRELAGDNGDPMRMDKDRAREIRKRLKTEFNMEGAPLKFRKRVGHVPRFQIERSLAFGSGARQPLR